MIYDYEVTTGTGESLSLADYKGKVILVVHYDHFSAEDIRKVAKSDSILVVPEKILLLVLEEQRDINCLFEMIKYGR